MKKPAKTLAFEFLAISLGTFIYSLATNTLVGPHDIAPGGVTGFAVVLYGLTGIPISLTNLAINLPLLFFAIKILGRETGIKTIYATILISVFLSLIPLKALSDHVLISGLAGGALMGVGLGLVFYFGGTTGGTDLMGAIANGLNPSIKHSTFMLAIDFIVVVFAGLASRNIDVALYSSLTLYAIGRGLSMVLDGSGYSVAFYIISDKYQEIGQKIMEDLDRGVTAFYAQGLYTKSERLVLFTVVSRAEFGRVKSIVLEKDPYAFLITTESSEVLGEGFSFQKEDRS